MVFWSGLNTWASSREIFFVCFNWYKLRYENFRREEKKNRTCDPNKRCRPRLMNFHMWKARIIECKWRQRVAKPSSLQFTWSINWVLFRSALSTQPGPAWQWHFHLLSPIQLRVFDIRFSHVFICMWFKWISILTSISMANMPALTRACNRFPFK